MTVWRVGMLAVCVDASPRDEHVEYYGRADYCSLEEGAVYTVLGVQPPELEGEPEWGITVEAIPRTSPDFYETVEDPWGGLHMPWGASRFRPAVTISDEEALIARIKNCTPQRVVA